LVAGLDRRDPLFGVGIWRDLLRFSAVRQTAAGIFVLILLVAVILFVENC